MISKLRAVIRPLTLNIHDTEDYLNSITQSAAYKYYMNENDGAKALISNYFTIDELKEEIKKSYDKIFLEYYKNIRNNDNKIVNQWPLFGP